MNETEMNETEIYKTCNYKNFAKSAFQDHIETPFQAAVSRHLLDGCRKFTEPKESEKQSVSRQIFTEITKIKLLRPERGATNINNHKESGIRTRSSLIRVIMDIFNGSQTASILDYHTVQRFGTHVCNGIYVHFECVPFKLLNEYGDIVDPRVKQTIKGANKPYELDSRFVMTIAWPDHKDARFLDNILSTSPYPKGMIVNGRISWENFISNELFADFIGEIKQELINEKPENHPAILMGGKIVSEFKSLNFKLKESS
jgi:hypothetical protein